MTLSTSSLASSHMQQVLTSPGWTTMIPRELARLNALRPPTPHAGSAHRMAVAWLSAPLAETEAEMDEILKLRDRIAAGTGHPREHLGEAQSIVLAKRFGPAVFVAEDGDAREESRVEGVPAASILGLLGLHLHQKRLTTAAAQAIIAQLHGGGRGYGPTPSLDLATLRAQRHLVVPKKASDPR